MDEKERSRKRRQKAAHKEYQRQYQLAYYHKKKAERTPEQKAARKEYQKAYVMKNRAELQKKRQIAARRQLYRLSEDEFQALLKKQEWECAICRRLLVAPVVDHDHHMGNVRGLLCRKCNAALGLLDDNPELLERAAKYLTRSWFGATSTTSRRRSRKASLPLESASPLSTGTKTSKSAKNS